MRCCGVVYICARLCQFGRTYKVYGREYVYAMHTVIFLMADKEFTAGVSRKGRMFQYYNDFSFYKR